ncbi:MAG: anhydro-N-acetylmuramic acid kinase [Candidatus Hodarchaeota archaeon]
MQPLIKLINKTEKFVIGLMSGTSLDGIDAALIKIRNNGIDTKVNLLNFHTFPYAEQLKNELLEISQPGQGTVDQICRLNFVVGEYFSDAVLEICKLSNLDVSQVDLIGSHGQTIHHLPDKIIYFNKSIRSTLQIGEPSVIANRTGCVTVANFRSADVAQDGQGAPLVPYFDFLMFHSAKRNRVVLNIGGIANITILRKNGTANDVLAYDTGPGNMVINALMKKFYNKDYDENGSIALTGEISETLLSKLLQHHFFNKSIPKSTGREQFGDLFIIDLLNQSTKLKLKAKDIIATVTELTVRSIMAALKFSPLPIEQIDELIISGGGIHNQAILKSLINSFRHSDILKTDHFNVPGDAKEAICFAVLANETISGNCANLPSVTGAKRATILGTICTV